MHDKLKTFTAYKSNRRLICYFKSLTPALSKGEGVKSCGVKPSPLERI
jgi:hypothetical protein